MREPGALFQPEPVEGGDEAIDQDILEIKKGLHQQVMLLKHYDLLVLICSSKSIN